jgi:hypothetical protein
MKISEIWRMKATSVIDTVAVDMMIAQANARTLVPIGGIAHAGARGISKVEVQVDGGEWREAQLRTPAKTEAQQPAEARKIGINRCQTGCPTFCFQGLVLEFRACHQLLRTRIAARLFRTRGFQGRTSGTNRVNLLLAKCLHHIAERRILARKEDHDEKVHSDLPVGLAGDRLPLRCTGHGCGV